MEPNCAICNGPAYRQCPCEHQSLILAVEQSEQRVLHPMWDEIRYWVTTQAKAEIHRDFQARSSLRRAQHSKYLYQNSGRFTNEMLDRVNNELRRGIDEDWRMAVQRYPEVLDYFYTMVGWTVRGACAHNEQRPVVPLAAGIAGGVCGEGCLRGFPHGPIPPPILSPTGGMGMGMGTHDGRSGPRPFCSAPPAPCPGSVYESSSGYSSGGGSPSAISSQPHPFTYTYGRPRP